MVYTPGITFTPGEVLTAEKLSQVLANIEYLYEQTAPSGWVNYTPSPIALTLGNGSVTGRYMRIGSLIVSTGLYTHGSTSSVAANARFTLPAVPAAGSEANVTIGSAVSTIGATRRPAVAETASGSAVTFVFEGGRISNTIPGTWATGSTLSWYVAYEAAP